MNIRRFSPADLPGLLAVQAESLAGESWRGVDYLQLNRQIGGLILVAEQAPSTGDVLGFAAMQQVFEHAEVLNLAVRRAHRRTGIGRALLLESCRRVRQNGASSISLEVRPSNHAALQLYHSLGFVLHSTRSDYYSEPLEDAYVLTLKAGDEGFAAQLRTT